ncbi:unnamed protein product [Protopolystoma xenopodis]|uniref:Uncharacterized protein n=1 Tax=Protopolystoma xenopodis TaxID=117903 RepID=A0A448XLJ7_9PLAT|nr:unnamed protein product [Protopolystoma xenopodis]
MEANDILGEKNLMNRRLEEDTVSDNFAYSGKTRMEQDQRKEDSWIKEDLPLTGRKEIAMKKVGAGVVGTKAKTLSVGDVRCE